MAAPVDAKWIKRKGYRGGSFLAALDTWLQSSTFGHFPKTQEAADVVVTTPNGRYAVIECTMGMLRTDNKLPTVTRRANELKERLKAGGSAHLGVLPLIVTSLLRERVAAELEQAERLGVVVITREILEVAIERTLLPPNPDAIYDEAVRSLAEAAAKLGNS